MKRIALIMIVLCFLTGCSFQFGNQIIGDTYLPSTVESFHRSEADPFYNNLKALSVIRITDNVAMMIGDVQNNQDGFLGLYLSKNDMYAFAGYHSLFELYSTDLIVDEWEIRLPNSDQSVAYKITSAPLQETDFKNVETIKITNGKELYFYWKITE